MNKRASAACTMGTLGAFLLLACRPSLGAPPTDEQVQKITAAAPDQAMVRPARARKLLVFTRAAGFVHSSIETGARAMQILGQKTGAFTATVSDDVAMFEPDTLKQFDAVLMLSTTGHFLQTPGFDKLADADKPAANAREDRLKKSLVAFVAGGKGLAGIHAASDTYDNDLNGGFPEYGRMIGGYFDQHPWHEKVGVRVEDTKSPLTSAFKGDFQITDEIYQFKDPYARTSQRVLLGLDTTRTDMTKNTIHRKDNDFAVSWIKSYGQGRVFYCSLGHREEIYWNPEVLRYYLNGLQFAVGDLRADTTPLLQIAGQATGQTAAQSATAVAETPSDPVDNVMGEYAGTYTPANGQPVNVTAKVVAEGGNNYRLVFSMPPAQADGQTQRIEMTGKLENGALGFTGRVGDVDVAGMLAGGVISAAPAGGGQVQLRKQTRQSPTLGLKPPAGAAVLLPYAPNTPPTLDQWTNQNWVPMTDGSVRVKGGDNRTKREFGDARLHLEFMSPYMPDARGQGRGNSGVYLQDRYEVQVLDSFGLETKDNEVGGIYQVAVPRVNAALPPGQWQTYDMIYHAPQLAADGSVQKNPTITIQLNGQTIHENVEIPRSTGGGAQGFVKQGPLRLQDHGNAVRYRNIWVADLNPAPTATTSNTQVSPSRPVQLPGDVPIAGASSRGRRVTVQTPVGPVELQQVPGPTLNLVTAKPAANDFRPLFNGKDLSGWGTREGAGPKVEDGAIHIQKGSGDIWTTEQFGDFVLDLEYKVEKGSNSGVIIRDSKPGDWFSGIEIQVFDSAGKQKPDVHDSGAVYDVLAPSKNAEKPAGEWNRMTITAKGPILQVAMNGQQVIDMNLDRWTEAGKNPDGSNNKFKKAYKDMPRVGHIELQDHGQPVWFRNIKIKELK